MKLRKQIRAAHREYSLTLIRTDGTRIEWYIPQVWSDKARAQADADRRNAHYTHGRFVVEYRDVPACVEYGYTIKL